MKKETDLTLIEGIEATALKENRELFERDMQTSRNAWHFPSKGS